MLNINKQMDMERNRAWRRKKTQSVWKRRLKEHIEFALIPSKEQITVINAITGRKLKFPVSWREPKTWIEFKNEVKWARLLRDSGRPATDKSDQIDAHHKNKLERKRSKKLIDEGIEEHEDRYAEDPDIDPWFDEEWDPKSYDDIIK